MANIKTMPDGTVIDFSILSPSERKRFQRKLKKDKGFNKLWKLVDKYEKAQLDLVNAIKEFTSADYENAMKAEQKQVTVSDYCKRRSIERKYQTPIRLDPAAMEAKPIIDSWLKDSLSIKGDQKELIKNLVANLFGGMDKLKWNQNIQEFLMYEFRDERLKEAQRIIRESRDRSVSREYVTLRDKDEEGNVVREFRF